MKGKGRQGASASGVDAEFANAVAAHRQGQWQDAFAGYAGVLRRQPRHVGALHMMGVLALQQGNAAEAARLISQAIALDPRDAQAHGNLGLVYYNLGRHADALASYARALALKPGKADVLSNQGLSLEALGRPAEALASYDAALAAAPTDVAAWSNRSSALRSLGRFDEALDSAERALAADPRHAEAWLNRGAALKELRRYEEAMRSYEQALAIRPGFAEVYYNCGVLFQKLGRHADALQVYDRALALRPAFADALYNRGIALKTLRQHDEAGASFVAARAIRPDLPYVEGYVFDARIQACDWTGYDTDCARIVAAAAAGQPATMPFSLLALTDAPEVQLRAARTLVQSQYTMPALPLPPRRAAHDRLRIGYVSADLRDHALSYLMAGVFEAHDRRRVETFAYSLDPGQPGAMRERVRAAFEHVHDVHDHDDAAIAALMREHEIDVAIDLMGYTSGCRPAVFAQRAAPVQVTYLGYPGTMGAPFIDWIIADRFVIPPAAQADYAERVAYLPQVFQANDAKRAIAPSTPPREVHGLPAEGFVWCCFNNSYKITPAFFEVWLGLLAAVEGSVLWLLAERPAVAERLRAAAKARGIDPARLVFAGRLPYAEHLARLRHADLFLDTLPFNAGTTASDALWAGVPVLTCAGRAFAARMAGSLLHALDLPELVTHSVDDYARRALALARDPAALAALRTRLARGREPGVSPLFDTAGFTRDFEALLFDLAAQGGVGPAGHGGAST